MFGKCKSKWKYRSSETTNGLGLAVLGWDNGLKCSLLLWKKRKTNSLIQTSLYEALSHTEGKPRTFQVYLFLWQVLISEKDFHGLLLFLLCSVNWTERVSNLNFITVLKPHYQKFKIIISEQCKLSWWTKQIYDAIIVSLNTTQLRQTSAKHKTLCVRDQRELHNCLHGIVLPHWIQNSVFQQCKTGAPDMPLHIGHVKYFQAQLCYFEDFSFRRSIRVEEFWNMLVWVWDKFVRRSNNCG